MVLVSLAAFTSARRTAGQAVQATSGNRRGSAPFTHLSRQAPGNSFVPTMNPGGSGEVRVKGWRRRKEGKRSKQGTVGRDSTAQQGGRQAGSQPASVCTHACHRLLGPSPGFLSHSPPSAQPGHALFESEQPARQGEQSRSLGLKPGGWVGRPWGAGRE